MFAFFLLFLHKSHWSDVVFVLMHFVQVLFCWCARQFLSTVQTYNIEHDFVACPFDSKFEGKNHQHKNNPSIIIYLKTTVVCDSIFFCMHGYKEVETKKKANQWMYAALFLWLLCWVESRVASIERWDLQESHFNWLHTEWTN